MHVDLFHVADAFRGAPKDGPRKATDFEIKAYANFLRRRQNLPDLGAIELHFHGAQTRSGDNRVCIGATFGNRRVEDRTTIYDNGAYSVIFPGHDAHRARVTMERLDDAGNVTSSSTLPVEPKKGGVIWSRDDVRKAHGPVAKAGKRKAAGAIPAAAEPIAEQMPEIAAPAAVEREASSAMTHDAPEPVDALHGPKITHPEPVTIADELPADPVAALLARVEAIEARLSTLPAESEVAPTGEVVPFPNAARPRRTAAHERAIRRAWAERKAARLQRAIAADHMRMREQVQDALRTAVERERIERAKRKRAAQRARRVTADLRQDIAQARKRREWWEGAARRQFSKRAAIEKQETFQRQRADVLHAQLTRLRQDMADPSQPERASDLAQLIRERDEARTALAALQRRAETAEKARDGMADAFEALAVRVARAEAALRKAA